jgi:hypothetical protein
MTIQLGRRRLELRRGAAWLLILVAALVAFELFNFSTTEYALGTFFGARDALGLGTWASVLAIAFCGIDFAGLSRLFTPATEWRREPKEVWLLTGAWLLGALMNAAMTWWAVASALSDHPLPGNALVPPGQVIQIVPVFVALLVWLTRVMLIGSLSTAGDRLRAAAPRRDYRPAPKPAEPARPAFDRRASSSALPSRAESSAANASRASTVRSYTPPTRNTAPARYEGIGGASYGSYGSERSSQPRGGMPLGASIPEPAHELQYVDLD